MTGRQTPSVRVLVPGVVQDAAVAGGEGEHQVAAVLLSAAAHPAHRQGGALRSDTRFYDDRLEVVERTEDVRAQLALTIAAGLSTGPEDADWRAIWRAVLAAGFELDQRRDVQASTTRRSTSTHRSSGARLLDTV